MDLSDNAREENRRLRRAMRDLVALSTLPAVWVGLSREGIGRSLADVLLSTLSVDLIYVRLTDPTAHAPIEVIRDRNGLCGSNEDAVRAAIASVLRSGREEPPATIRDPFGAGTLHIAVTRFGVGRDHGTLVVCSRKREFPTEQDRLLLGVVANQTAVVMQRRRAEDEVRRSSEELAEFFENASVGLHWVGADGIVLRANRAELDMLGYAREEYVGKPIADFHVDKDVIRDILNKLSAGEKLADYPARLRCKDGSIKDVLIDSSVMWRDGEFIHTRCFTRDVTERNRTESALADARAQLDAALEAGAIATWTWDIGQNRLFADQRLARLFNLPPSDAHGGSLDKYIQSIHPEDVRMVTGALEHSIQSGEDYEADYRIMQADGSLRWVTARGRVQRDAAARAARMAGVLVDITERKRLEEDLRVRVKALAAADLRKEELLASLRDADRRKDEFLATLAHELRNPLAPIRNSLQILKMPRIDAATVAQARDMMERQVHSLVRLVDDLLDVARVMRGKIELRKEPVELATVVARAVETVQPLIEVQGHQLDLRVAQESLLVDADAIRLAQVIGNLLTNAAKYSEANGHIQVSAERQGQQVVLRVRDHGIGIAPDMLPHVFDLFVQADHASTKAQGGLGIGLTLVKNLVHMHGGTVKAWSGGLGKGSEFVIRLPLVAQKACDSLERPLDAEQGQETVSSGHRLLVVDDNEDAAVSLATLLRLQGHDVRVVHDGPTALAEASSFLPHMVFLDIGMPDMDGYEVARKMRHEAGLETVVLAALTGWGQEDDRHRSAAAGFDHHLVKPVEPKMLNNLLAGLGPALT
jgi:PAS domain S-box-containing protein